MLNISRLGFNLRFYSIIHAPKKPVKYKETINLPKTKFPTHLTTTKRKEIEHQLLKDIFASAYRYQLAHNKEPTFTLHDGPPYANGELHMGHAVNKILKDITLRYFVAKGQKVNYVPGWDCHGLPIELKATESKKTTETEGQQSASEIRKKSREFASIALQNQKEEFCSWGILSDWSDANHIYLTMQPEFIQNQLQMFLNFYENGLVYRDLKPVYWSPSSRTALAEAELEYNTNFISPSVYVRFELNDVAQELKDFQQKEQNIYALIWTTTPWTLPSNQAICYNASLEYALIALEMDAQEKSDGLYLIATNLLQDFEKTTNIKVKVIKCLRGTELSCCSYKHPVDATEQSLPFFHAEHVQDTKGTGLVHTAPAHGPDDFRVSLRERLVIKSFVNGDGIYTKEAPEFLRGKYVLEEGDELVLNHISDNVVFESKFAHAYPIDWRTKKPVIIRASEQWFMHTEKLKERALAEIDKIEIYPRVTAVASKKSLITQVQKRPYWCISRQRVWGVPIPVFYEKQSGAVVINKSIVDHLCRLIELEGNIDFWWTESVKDILPAELLKDCQLNGVELVKGSDIFDIWFDSGSTWASVLKDKKIADLYLEGYDQFNGWFQSSLLTSVAARNCAPYKALFVHGFAVDEKGLKMSKSLGNVISPKDVVEKYGVDVLRWWVASHGTQHTSITVSDNLLHQSTDQLKKIRGILRYLNGVIGQRTSADAAQKPTEENQIYLNRYMLSQLVDFDQDITKYYSVHEYNHVVANIQNFIANQISAIYVHLIKDRLYCGDNEDLQNIRFTLKECYKLLCKSLWPITPFLVEESWSYYDATQGFHQQNVIPNATWKNEDVENIINTALNIKRLINQEIKDINTWTLDVHIECKNQTKLQQLKCLQNQLNATVNNSELTELLQVANVTLSDKTNETNNWDRKDWFADTDDYRINIKRLAVILCPRCRRFNVNVGDELVSKAEDCTCTRCKNVLSLK